MSEECCKLYVAVPSCLFRQLVRTQLNVVDETDEHRVDEYIDQFDQIRRTYVDEDKENQNPQQ